MSMILITIIDLHVVCPHAFNTGITTVLTDHCHVNT